VKNQYHITSSYQLNNIHCLKKATVTLHTITSMHIKRFWQSLVEILLKEYAIKW